MNIIIFSAIFIPIILGALVMVLPEKKLGIAGLTAITTGGLSLVAALVVYIAVCAGDESYRLFSLTDSIDISFRVDGLAKLFSVMVIMIWILAGIFSYDYMKHEHKLRRYFGFYLITAGVLLGLDYSSNLVTMYMFYEFMTIASMPLVIHEEEHVSIMAAMKYLIYSFAGAYAALFGVFFLSHFCGSLEFVAGGNLDMSATAGHEGLVLLVVFLMLIGFGVKAGSFPLHAWLPTAHPVAPSPASAVLSGVIVKGGVLAIIRVVFYLVGADFIAGSWVQYAWMILSLITVFMGSMLAYKEPVFKKRLAYSTVSQLSYILFGLSLLDPQGATGGLLHVIFHAVIKTALFLSAGAFISRTGLKEASGFKGIGKAMPLTLVSYTFVSLGLIGIPPFSGFISKWYLATGALESGMGVFSYIGPVVLLASALLTAGYLLPVTIDGFLPGEEYKEKQENKENLWICIPLVILAWTTFMLGLLPGPLTEFIESITANWF